MTKIPMSGFSYCAGGLVYYLRVKEKYVWCIPVIMSISQRTTVIGSSGQRLGRKPSGWHYIINRYILKE